MHVTGQALVERVDTLFDIRCVLRERGVQSGTVHRESGGSASYASTERPTAFNSTCHCNFQFHVAPTPMKPETKLRLSRYPFAAELKRSLNLI